LLESFIVLELTPAGVSRVFLINRFEQSVVVKIAVGFDDGPNVLLEVVWERGKLLVNPCRGGQCDFGLLLLGIALHADQALFLQFLQVGVALLASAA